MKRVEVLRDFLWHAAGASLLEIDPGPGRSCSCDWLVVFKSMPKRVPSAGSASCIVDPCCCNDPITSERFSQVVNLMSRNEPHAIEFDQARSVMSEDATGEFRDSVDPSDVHDVAHMGDAFGE